MPCKHGETAIVCPWCDAETVRRYESQTSVQNEFLEWRIKFRNGTVKTFKFPNPGKVKLPSNGLR